MMGVIHLAQSAMHVTRGSATSRRGPANAGMGVIHLERSSMHADIRETLSLYTRLKISKKLSLLYRNSIIYNSIMVNYFNNIKLCFCNNYLYEWHYSLQFLYNKMIIYTKFGERYSIEDNKICNYSYFRDNYYTDIIFYYNEISNYPNRDRNNSIYNGIYFKYIIGEKISNTNIIELSLYSRRYRITSYKSKFNLGGEFNFCDLIKK
jgi:hypothetical protein